MKKETKKRIEQNLIKELWLTGKTTGFKYSHQPDAEFEKMCPSKNHYPFRGSSDYQKEARAKSWRVVDISKSESGFLSSYMPEQLKKFENSFSLKTDKQKKEEIYEQDERRENPFFKEWSTLHVGN